MTALIRNVEFVTQDCTMKTKKDVMNVTAKAGRTNELIYSLLLYMVKLSWPTFIVSFAIGIFFVYITQVDPKVIIIFPTPDNVDKVQYKDSADNCYHFKHEITECPQDKFIDSIPVQK